MDVDGETSFLEWQDDTVFSNFPDELYFKSCYDNLESGKRNEVSSRQKNYSIPVDTDLDYAIAMSLQDEFIDEVKESENAHLEKPKASKPLSIVDEQWELIDPIPDIHALFVEYDDTYFYGRLKSVEVRWSARMTLCAGLCCYQGKGGLCSIRLSEPLLKLRPRRDLVETLLHEMIHAFLFVTENNKDRDGHGPEFLSHMYRINREAGTKITVYHNFHDEVNLYKQHWWKCDGPCKNRSPYFGVVKRALNRAPGPNDNWWMAHQQTCGGTFIKIKEPSNFSEKKDRKRKLQSDSKTKPSESILKFVKSSSQEDNNRSSQQRVLDTESPALHIQKTSSPRKDSLGGTNATDKLVKKNFIPFLGAGHKLGSSSSKVHSKIAVSLKDLHFERTHFSSSSSESKRIISPGKVLVKKVVPSSPIKKSLSNADSLSCSSVKASTKNKFHSSSPRKTVTLDDFFGSSSKTVPTKKDFPSNLSGNLFASSPSTSVQIPRISSTYKTYGSRSGLGIFSKTSSNKSKIFDKIAVENTVSPQNKLDYPQESCITGVKISSGVSEKLYCPVCSNFVSEEINVHLDKCLQNSTI